MRGIVDLRFIQNMHPVHDLFLDTKDLDFSQRESRVLSFEEAQVKTVFTDEEAVAVCGGITNIGKAKRLWVRHQRGNTRNEDIFLAHQYAMQTAEKYGFAILSKAISLPLLPFPCGDVTKVFAEFDIRGQRLNNPVVRLMSEELDEQFKLYFYAKSEQGKKKQRDPNILVLRGDRSGEVAHITRSGILTPINDAAIPKPVINLLFRFRDSPRETIVYYGRQLGRCSYCGRELSDERSLKVGYGKRCAESNSEQWGN